MPTFLTELHYTLLDIQAKSLCALKRLHEAVEIHTCSNNV